MGTELENASQTLGVAVNAPVGEIKRAYMNQVTARNADLFSNDATRQAGAREALLRINQAYEFIQRERIDEFRDQPLGVATTPDAPVVPVEAPPARPTPAQSPTTIPVPAMAPTAPRPTTPPMRRQSLAAQEDEDSLSPFWGFFIFLGVLFAVIVLVMVWKGLIR